MTAVDVTSCGLSPVPSAQRVVPPAVDLFDQRAPKIDFVVISHSHYDHLVRIHHRASVLQQPSCCAALPQRLTRRFFHGKPAGLPDSPRLPRPLQGLCHVVRAAGTQGVVPLARRRERD